MCGIAGIVTQRVEELDARLARALDAERHRGPDDRGTWVEGGVGMGQVRLAILDLSEHGHQPMLLDDGRLVLVFNGEIFNYLEIRDELQSLGHSFRGGSDTEVILHAYDEWGTACCERFNGMWGFALYDRKRCTLFCSRDRFGVKPFYYSIADDEFVFGSEIKAIIAASPGLSRPDESYLARFLVTALTDDGEDTFFANVKSLLPGHSMTIDLSSELPRIASVERYWEFDVDRVLETYDFTDPVATFGGLLRDSIRLRLRSDVPVGTCLSGGLDSSSIVALASQDLDAPVWTFSALYEQTAYDESRFVRSVNASFPTVPHEVHPRPDRLIEVMTRIAWHQDQPSAGPGLYSQWHVMEAASRDVKVLLDGQGADEVLGGYKIYFDAYARSLVQTVLSHPSLASLKRAVHGLSAVGDQGVNASRIVISELTPTALKRVLKPVADPTVGTELTHDFLAGWTEAGPRELNGPFQDRLSNVLHDAVFRSSLPALLRYEDRNSMAFSIEARTPFLDYRLVEFALALPYWERINGEWTKWVLRRAVTGILPDEVTWRRDKMGYPTPFAEWLRTDFRADADEILHSSAFRQRGIFETSEVDRLWKEHLAGASDNSWSIWRWLSVEFWYRVFQDDAR